MPDLIGKCSICTGGVSARYHSAGKYIHVCEQCGAVGLSGFGEALPEIQMIPRQGVPGTPAPAGAGMAAPPPNNKPSRAPKEYGPTRIHNEFDLADRLAAGVGAANLPPRGLNFPPYAPKGWPNNPAPDPAVDLPERIAASAVEEAAGLPARSVDLRQELYGDKWKPVDAAAANGRINDVVPGHNRYVESEYSRGWKVGFEAGKLAALSVPVKGAPE